MHILFATDGSEGARVARDTLARLPVAAGSRATVLHVITRYATSGAPLPHAVLDPLRADEDARAARVLAEAEQALAAAGWQVETRTAEGHPAQQITEAAADLNADLIVTGALGLSQWMRLVLGSTSLAVVRHAPCPVWVVKRPFKAGRADILVASDGSDHARAAIRTLCRLPLPADAVAHLVHVVPSVNAQLHLSGTALDPPVLEPLYELGHHFRLRGEHILKEDAETLSARFSEVRPFLEEGDARRRILAAAAEVEADLIVMGSHGLTGAREFFLGSVSHKVLKHARTGVLVVPLPAP